MRLAGPLFPGVKPDPGMVRALWVATRARPTVVWHTETTLPNIELAVIPGGFSYGDYLRCGAIAARSSIMADLMRKAERGLKVLGVCNGFQILTEAGLLPGALLRNSGLR